MRMEQHELEQSVKVFEALGGWCNPTMGILGAVLGLIHAMGLLDQPEKLGPAIAVAFVATIYGVGSANILFLPIANRFKAFNSGRSRRSHVRSRRPGCPRRRRRCARARSRHRATPVAVPRRRRGCRSAAPMGCVRFKPATTAARAEAMSQYGFASDAPVRSSMRVASGVASSSDRTADVRLSRPIPAVAGAKEPGTGLRYALTECAPNSVIDGRCSSRPAMACRPTWPSVPSAPARTGSPSRHSEMCRCAELPECSENGLGMNVANLPLRRVISLTAYFNRALLSAASSGRQHQVRLDLPGTVFGEQSLQGGELAQHRIELAENRFERVGVLQRVGVHVVLEDRPVGIE